MKINIYTEERKTMNIYSCVQGCKEVNQNCDTSDTFIISAEPNPKQPTNWKKGARTEMMTTKKLQRVVLNEKHVHEQHCTDN